MGNSEPSALPVITAWPLPSSAPLMPQRPSTSGATDTDVMSMVLPEVPTVTVTCGAVTTNVPGPLLLSVSTRRLSSRLASK